MGCIFCEILEGREAGSILYEDDLHAALLDKYPIDTGHSLFLPKRHYERITDMEPADVGRMFEMVPRVAGTLLKVTGADAFSIAQNNGRAAKQIIPHVHIHIIPRYSSRGSSWTKRQIASKSELESLASRFRESF